ncbi:ATP-binding cassette domain-containing protein [Candidatus Dojkabacteria bacterium]|nr:ATP-binding cassette domain-containing protein [Candidatus Dojkabacteria bacterium]
MISLKNINKSYLSGEIEFQALKEISLEISEGDFVAIVGPSGSGKSTLMNIIGCLDRFDSGELRLDGKNVADMDDDELALWRGQKIGFVFQSFNLLNKFTVLENTTLPSLYVKIENPENKARKVLDQVGLGDKLKNTPLQLSGGQRQRVAIARALMADPVIILADEPTGNLDSKTGKTIMKLFQKLNNEGKTIIVITHDPAVAKFAKKVIKLVDGKVHNENAD